MKKTVIQITILCFIIFMNTGCNRERFTIAGSETMYPMLKLLSEDYRYVNSDVEAVIKGGGSKEGLKKLVNNEADMAASSLDFDNALQDQLATIGTFAVVLLAYDGIAVVVNKENPVEKIDLHTLSDIFSGKIRNWKELGGEDHPIQVILRNKRSGTAAYMQEHILRKKDLGEIVYSKFRGRKFTKHAITASNNREIARLIDQNRFSISYMGMGSAKTEGKGRVKKLQYAISKEGPFVTPSVQSVEKNEYKLSRPLMLIYRSDNGGKLDQFIEYLKTQRARKKVVSTGYLDSIHMRLMLETIVVHGKKY